MKVVSRFLTSISIDLFHPFSLRAIVCHCGIVFFWYIFLVFQTAPNVSFHSCVLKRAPPLFLEKCMLTAECAFDLVYGGGGWPAAWGRGEAWGWGPAQSLWHRDIDWTSQLHFSELRFSHFWSGDTIKYPSEWLWESDEMMSRKPCKCKTWQGYYL